MSVARRWALSQNFFSQTIQKIMAKKNCDNTVKRVVSVDGCMTFGKLTNGLNVADFQCCESVEMEPFIAKCKVQAMRDGNVYITELPKKHRNSPLFRDDNCSLSLGKNGRYYFVFSLPEEEVELLPNKLLRQAEAIARKMLKHIYNV